MNEASDYVPAAVAGQLVTRPFLKHAGGVA